MKSFVFEELPFFSIKNIHDNLVLFQNPLKSLQTSFDFRSFWIRSIDGIYVSWVKERNTIVPLVQILSLGLHTHFPLTSERNALKESIQPWGVFLKVNEKEPESYRWENNWFTF